MKIPLVWLKDYVKTDASPREIASSFTQLGLMLDKPLDSSGVLDLEHRMDRSDWLSILGCARDYAAFSQLKLNYPQTNTKPVPKVKPSEMVEITVTTPHVRRFNTRLVKNVKVGESPNWLKERLTAYGIKSINNVVDITNFVMVEYGQPMHAQDTAKLSKREITLRPAKKSERITTILGTDITLDPDTFILSSGGVPTVIGGIVGGSETAVTNTTTELILDAGNYDQSVVRKTSRRLKIINETVSRYDKFLHPDLCEIALDRATYLLEKEAGATVYINYDYYPTIATPTTMTLTYSRLQTLSGLVFSTKVIKRILTALEYQIVKETKDSLTLTIPSFRTDVEVEDDIVADILRINDYSQIPNSPLTTPVPPEITHPLYRFEDTLRDLMVAQGAHEHITTSLVQDRGVPGEIKLSNALSSDQNALRTSLVPKLTEIRDNYEKYSSSHHAIPLFEIGVVFYQDQSGYHERHDLTVQSNSLTPATLLHHLGLTPKQYGPLVVGKPIKINGESVGTYPAPGCYTLDTALLLKHYVPYQGYTTEISHLPTRDLSIDTPPTVDPTDLTQAFYKLDPHLYQISFKASTLNDSTTNLVFTLTWPITTTTSDILVTLKEIKKFCLAHQYRWKSD